VALTGVRRDYQRLLVAARSNGLGRDPHETPAEFNNRLLALLEDATEAEPIAELTEDYERARYGESMPESGDTADLAGNGDATASATAIVDVLIARLEALGASAPPTTEDPSVEGAVIT
jgi:hypothetical protein